MRTARNQWKRLGVVALVGLVLGACAAPMPRGAPAGAASGPASPSAAAGGERSGSSPAAAPTPPVRLRAAFVAISGAMLPAWIAVDRGIYQRYGLDVELTYISGLTRIAEGLIAGELDFGITPSPTAMAPGIQGADLVLIASWSSKSAFSLYSQPSISSVYDLRGKRIATSQRGSLSELWAAEVLQRYGLDAKQDYTILALGGQPEQLAGLQNGAVDAAALTVPTNILARKLGLREVLGYKEHALEFAGVGPVTARPFLAEQPAVVERFLKATAEGVAVMMRDTETSLAVLGEWTRTDDREQLEETLAFDRYRAVRDMIPSPEGLQAAMDSLAVNNPAALGADPMKHVDLTLIRKLNDSGFIDSLYR
jgi:NitT/TauT family transport system substrate-binding protein